ncbi:MAG: hypothetical protein JJE04_06430 [Acidobacteriia bacterium]|nr:hypothetical protein [Terriglobia bacterium]
MNLEKLFVWANYVYIVSVVLAAVASFAIYRLSATINAAKDRELTRFQVDAQTRISKAQVDAEQARVDTATALVEQEKLRTENLNLAVLLEKERQARLELERQIQPRRIGPEHQTLFFRLLSPFKGQSIEVVYLSVSGEVVTFAKELNAVLLASGWRSRAIPIMNVAGNIPSGIVIQAKNPRGSDVVNALASAFVQAGFAHTWEARPEMAGDVFNLRVGTK